MYFKCMIYRGRTMTAAMDDDDLRRLVTAFYAQVRQDPELGPIFNDAIADWPGHLVTLGDFWSSVMRVGGRYKGNPLAAHLKHAERITPAHFDRWLALWQATTDALMTPDAAAALQARAGRIAESLQLALFYRPARESADVQAVE